jgi:hypothetical protein
MGINPSHILTMKLHRMKTEVALYKTTDHSTLMKKFCDKCEKFIFTIVWVNLYGYLN